MRFSQPIYILQAKRTPIGSFQGSLSTVPAPELAATVIRALFESTNVSAGEVDQVILGSVLTAGVGQAPARQALIKSGIPNTAQALTVNKVCSSGLKAVILAAQEIALGNAELVVAGGMESMSQSPYLMPSLRNGARLGNATAIDSIVHDGLWDPYNNYHMGNAAELCATEYKISREEQDNFALESYQRAKDATEKGFFRDEIVPVSVNQGKTSVEVTIDEEPGKLKADKVRELKPAFAKDGTATAANSSSINDGAAALLVCSESYLKKHNLKPLARIVADGWNSLAPEWFTIAPVGAIERALAYAGYTGEQIDLYEINEAFSSVALACQRKRSIASEKLNISGGAVALGHPIGASGARILTTLLHNLKRSGGRLGAAAICNGGGEATALVVERVE